MSTDKLPQDDAQLEIALGKLFGEWRKAVSFGDRDSFVEDGALPGYFDQKFKKSKILFIGREVHSGCTNIVEHVRNILDDISNADPAWVKTLRIAYGLLNNVEEYNKIPRTPDFRRMAVEGDPKLPSFAIIEISKYANTGNSTHRSSEFEKYAYESMGVGENVSSRNFTREEIEILNPDLIISWNLMDALGPCFLQTLTETNASSRICLPPDITAWAYKFSSGREIPLLDTWHFSSGKSPRDNIYIPIRKALKKLGVNFPLRPSAECGAKDIAEEKSSSLSA